MKALLIEATVVLSIPLVVLGMTSCMDRPRAGTPLPEPVTVAITCRV